MTTESKQRGAAIKARREAVGVTFVGFYDQLNLTYKQGEWVENGQYGKNVTEMRDKAEKFLDNLEAKKAAAKKPVEPPHAKKGVKKAVLDDSTLAPEYKIFNNKEASQKQLEKFANGLCQSLLKSGNDIVTIPWAQFYEMLYAETGCGRFHITLLESIFSNQKVLQVPFLISFGNRVVIVCKDSLFAPVEVNADGEHELDEHHNELDAEELADFEGKGNQQTAGY